MVRERHYRRNQCHLITPQEATPTSDDLGEDTNTTTVGNQQDETRPESPEEMTQCWSQ